MEIVRGKGRGARKKERKSESQKLTRYFVQKGKKMLRKERKFFFALFIKDSGDFLMSYFFCLISQPLKVNERFF